MAHEPPSSSAETLPGNARRLDTAMGIVPGSAQDGRANSEVRGIADEAAPSTFALTTAVDIALVRAASTTVQPPQQMNGTAELNVTYLREASGPARIACTVVGQTSTMRLVEFTVADAEGELARGRSTYAVRTVRPR